MTGKEGKCLRGAWHEGRRRRRPDMRGVLPAHGVYDSSGPVAQLRLGAGAGQGEGCRIGNREGLKRFQLDIPES